MVNIFNNSILGNTVTITRGLEYTIKNQMESPELKTYNNLKLIIQNMSFEENREREKLVSWKKELWEISDCSIEKKEIEIQGNDM